jgi:hypothetical protein
MVAVLQQKKKVRFNFNSQLLSSPETKTYNLPWFKDPDLNTNRDLASKLAASPHLLSFLPSGANIKELPKSFLFTLIANEDPDLYRDMKRKALERTRLKNFKAIQTTTLNVSNELVTALNLFNDPDVSIIY